MKFKAFNTHGVIFNGESGDQNYGDCPFCSGENKFYVNRLNLLWDCKKCSARGNSYQFLEMIAIQNQKDLTEAKLTRLMKNRGLPKDAFDSYGLGVSGSTYTFPIYNENGKLQDVRTFKLGDKLLSTPGCRTGLFGLDRLPMVGNAGTIYICEGEWDCIAMNWLLKTIKNPDIAIGVPGASVFKQEWAPLFTGKNVCVCYDNDEAGEKGEKRISMILSPVVKSIKYLHWMDTFKKGFDLRDLITVSAVQSKKPKYTFRLITEMLRPKPRISFAPESDSVTPVNETEEIQKGKVIEIDNPPIPVTKKEVFEAIGKWLYINDFRGVEVSLATFVSNFIEGDPLWLFLVAPPGGSKTEILNTFSICDSAYMTSSLTPQSLISGADFNRGQDPSLIPQINNKVLIVKDFTTILSKNENEKEEIFGILRDAYDGKCGKVFGTGIRRSYESHFTIIAGVTPIVHEMGLYHQSLGERFIKFFIGSNLTHECEEMIIGKAISNLHQEIRMRSELHTQVKAFVDYISYKAIKNPLPLIPKPIQTKLIALAQFGARMRGTVSRDRYQQDMIKSKPSAEIGSRLGKQLAKMAVSLAIVNDRKEVNEDDYNICKKCMLDTVSQRSEDIIRKMVLKLPTINDSITTKDLGILTHYTLSTVSRILADMNMLGIVKRVGAGNKFEWTISEYVRDLITKSELYTLPAELNRELSVMPQVLKVKRRKNRLKSSIKIIGDRKK